MKRFLPVACLCALALPALAADIRSDRIAESVKTMTSDFFEGRAPGTVGEERTVGYLIGQFQALGLEPGGREGSWVQPVQLLHTRLGEPTRLGLEVDGRLQP